MECVVIGAGPGGLGVAALLERSGVRTVVLERGVAPLAKWRAGYDRLRINTSAWFSHPPRRRFPRAAALFPTRDEFVRCYDDYAAENGVRVEAGVTARRVERAGSAWSVVTPAGSWEAPAVVVATGKQHTPVVPEWPGREEFRPPLIHAAAYRNAARHPARRALVVGAGNSAMDVALDLADAGAAVWLSVRRPPHLTPRQVMGLPHDLFGVLARRAPRRLVDANQRLLARLVLGDLSEVGLARPGDGAVRRLEQEGRVPTVDSGEFSAALRARRIEVVAGVKRLEHDRVVLADGCELEPDLVVAATGYRSDLEPLVGHLGVLDSQGLPLACGGTTHPGAPRLHFLGFTDPRSGLLRELRLEARRVSRAVAAGR